MSGFGLEREVVDRTVRERAVQHFRAARIRLPTFAELAEPARIPATIRQALGTIDPDEAHPLNLFRVHWHNAPDRRGEVAVPEHLVLPSSFTGVDAPILVALGDRFPMIRTHKALAAYACLVPRLVTGGFDPTRQRAVWPSTGNYCRGGIAVSRILGCRGVAVLPEGMSAERFRWLERWVAEPSDIVRTPGTESNVKEIYDACHALAREPENVILNQFSEFGNHLVHHAATGRALERVFESARRERPGLGLAAFVAASGSAGTLGAGDYLKRHHGARIAVVEALECPTLLKNGYGAHNIQGIGDKHVPLIHNVMNTDYVVDVSDRGTDGLNVLFNTELGRRYMVERKDVGSDLVGALSSLGLSSIANVLGAIKLAKHLGLGPDDAVVTLATDGAELYLSERDKALVRDFGNRFDEPAAAETWGRHLAGAATDNVLELDGRERERIFNLGYFTWVEQQGVALEDFDRRRDQAFWRSLVDVLPAWDRLIEEFNARAGTDA